MNERETFTKAQQGALLIYEDTGNATQLTEYFDLAHVGILEMLDQLGLPRPDRSKMDERQTEVAEWWEKGETQHAIAKTFDIGKNTFVAWSKEFLWDDTRRLIAPKNKVKVTEKFSEEDKRKIAGLYLYYRKDYTRTMASNRVAVEMGLKSSHPVQQLVKEMGHW